MKYRTIDSPIGPLTLAGTAGDIIELIGFPSGKQKLEPGADWTRDDSAFEEAARQLAEYFDGRRRRFELKLNPGGTPFQMAVLEELQRIPYGETRSYGDIAANLGKPRAVRAVGAANGRNPLPIVIPCHRVVGADGSLTGFGGGIDTKRWLLALESADGQLLEMEASTGK